jgi:hypothetical protein
MTRPEKLPEEAQTPPEVLTPDELARHDEEVHRHTDAVRRAGQDDDVHAADSPRRDPGEPSSPPPKK